MKKICAISGQEFEITDDDLKFYEKMGVPVPTLCPEERQRRRLAWRNERKLYWRTCDGTGKKILSVFSPDKPFKIYDVDFWNSDKWDSKSFGRDFDFSRPFFEQFNALRLDVPQMSRSVTNNGENCDYINQAGWNKNCYLMFEAASNEDVYYSDHIGKSRSCADFSYGENCELCYECFDCENCYASFFLQSCKNCSDSLFLANCIGCRHCFGSINLRNKEFYFLNQKCSSESEYFEKLKNLELHKFSKLKNMRENATKFFQKFPHKYYHGIQNEDSTGDYLSRTQRCRDCFSVWNSQDCRFCADAGMLKNCYDITVFGVHRGAEFSYESHEIGDGCTNICFSDKVVTGNDIFYSHSIWNCHDLFGCVGFRHAEYCILNRQYSKAEYFALREKIIEHMKKTGEWGEFFPASISPFDYNETVANEYFPMTRDEVLKKGWKWHDEMKSVGAQNFVPLQKIPDSILDVSDTICGEILACENQIGTDAPGCVRTKCDKNYQIQKAELKFYRKMNLPIPRFCPDCRYTERMKLRNPRKLFDRKCDNCSVEISTTFAPDRPEKVFCENCYLKAVN